MRQAPRNLLASAFVAHGPQSDSRGRPHTCRLVTWSKMLAQSFRADGLVKRAASSWGRFPRHSEGAKLNAGWRPSAHCHLQLPTNNAGMLKAPATGSAATTCGSAPPAQRKRSKQDPLGRTRQENLLTSPDQRTSPPAPTAPPL